jgi:hypothetical protein
MTCIICPHYAISNSMSKQNLIPASDAYDLLMGVSVLTGSALVSDIARVVGDLAPPGLSEALNRKQIASKRWLLDRLHAHVGGALGPVTVLGGWYGVLSAMLLNDARFATGQVTSVDIDPSCAPVALLLNQRFVAQKRFLAITADMYSLDPTCYAPGRDALIINTSCEHIPDLKRWLRQIPAGQLVLLQSNNYRAIPEHISCVDSAEELAQLAGLRELALADALPMKNYTRFMIIGRN